MGAHSASSGQRSVYRDAVSHHLNQSATNRLAEQIALLRRRGFQALPLPNLMCVVDGLYLYRFTADGYLDTVVVRAADCAVGARVRDAFNPALPLREPQPIWSENGELADVIGELMRIDADNADTPKESHFSGHLDLSQ